jgi:biopolymer transport protein ExbB
MNKLLAFLMLLSLSLGTNTFAQEDTQGEEQTDTSNSIVADSSTEDSATEDMSSAVAAISTDDDPVDIKKSFTEAIKDKFIEGGWEFMSLVLICLIFGLAFAIERIIMLNLSTVNSDKFINDIDSALGSGGTEAAKELCRNTRGPVASIFYQGLDRAKEGLDVVEKSVVSYGSVQMGLLEKGMVWISLFIALAPMLGFMGTVIGMIDAFDAIEAAGDIQPKLVAHGIKVALLTTLAGLIVAVILQVFYNYIVSKIDDLVNTMEDSSITLVDLLIKHNALNK